MPLGNSITQANNTHLSYRYRLWEKLNEVDFDFDFVGSQNTHEGGGTPSYPNSSFDRDHEGHWGWYADQLLSSLPGWLANYTPDIVLLHGGSNDAINSQPTAGTVTELEQIIDVLRGDNPNVTVFIATLIPINFAPWNNNVNLLNAEIPGIVSRKNTASSRVILVDQNGGFNAATDTYDGVHPSPSGEEKMAQKWYDAIITQYPLPITLLG
ncbi:MAG: cellulose-binding protein, partial [Marivirga sp.]|nr:cellulose-binding protein [Marivirga sp.]